MKWLWVFLLLICPSAYEQDETFSCPEGKMTIGGYIHGTDEAVPNIPGLKNDFLIVADTNRKAENFISYFEESYRLEAGSSDTTYLRHSDEWKLMSAEEKLVFLAQNQEKNRVLADSAHYLNNRGQQQIWLINNSEDTVAVAMSDWAYVCVLQARAKNTKWYAVQYWRFASCGNSEHLKYFPPKTANSFIFDLPNRGDYQTKLRFKLLGKNKFYYSNAFDGKIDYCEFTEYGSSEEQRYARYKLETLIPWYDEL